MKLDWFCDCNNNDMNVSEHNFKNLSEYQFDWKKMQYMRNFLHQLLHKQFAYVMNTKTTPQTLIRWYKSVIDQALSIRIYCYTKKRTKEKYRKLHVTSTKHPSQRTFWNVITGKLFQSFFYQMQLHFSAMAKPTLSKWDSRSFQSWVISLKYQPMKT